MYDPKVCNLCAKEIKAEKIFLCFICKIGIEMEYKNLRKEAREQEEMEKLQFTRFDKLVNCG